MALLYNFQPKDLIWIFKWVEYLVKVSQIFTVEDDRKLKTTFPNGC